MKVKILTASPQNIDRDFAVVSRGGAADTRQSFERHMDTAATELYEEHIRELASRIEAQAKRLSQKADIGEMERYRELIAELLGEVVCGAYAYKREKSIDQRGRIRICATVNKINQKLDELAGQILGGAKDEIEIISRIDDIRGLIIDIML